MADALDVQEAIARLDVYRRQVELGARNVELLQTMLGDVMQALRTLEEWKKQTPGQRILVPLGANTFVRAQVDVADQVLLGVGRGFSAERPTEQAVQWLSTREGELRKEADSMSQAVFRLQQEAAGLQEAIEDAMARHQQATPQN